MILTKTISNFLILINFSLFSLPPTSAAAIVEEPVEKTNPTVTLYEEGVKDSQSFTAPSNIAPVVLTRGGYTATTPEEIAAKKAEEEAARKAAEEEARKAKVAEEMNKLNSQRKNINSMVALASSNIASCAGAGHICWPLKSFNYTELNNGFRTSKRPNHNGFDMLTNGGNPITAVADGKVIVSSESYGGYGVGVVVESVINGQRIRFTYGHMTYGTRAVQVGDTVTAGQLLGLVGSTGRSTANHLHLEVNINGSLVDPHIWLLNNAN